MRKRRTRENFIEDASSVHNGKYDYSRVELVNAKSKVEIICPEHGSFLQVAGNHLGGQGCPECGKEARKTSQRYTKDDFIKSVIPVHKDKYDYSEVEYVNSQTKVLIICPEHGPFEMKPNSHKNGQGCPKCGRIQANQNITLDYDEFLKRAAKVHSGLYQYDESTYQKYTVKMKMMCSTHGAFYQTPHSHISMKTGCPKCAKERVTEFHTKGWEVVHDLFKQIHRERYQYDESTYSDVSSKMSIRCKKHGWFEQKPYQHYGGSGCNQCAIEEVHENQKIGFEEFVERSEAMHGNRYSYSSEGYVDIFTSVTIICEKHGDFEQKPRDHYRGSGCPKCISSRGENEIRLLLESWDIEFEEQQTFDGLVHKGQLKCDFFLPIQNVVIEYNGRQHYEPIELFGGTEGLKSTQKRDLVKYQFLEEKGIDLIIVRYDEEDIGSFLKQELRIS